MNGVLTTGRQRNAFCFLCCLVYFMSYLTRMNYAACLAEIQDSLSLSKSIVSLPVTGSFLTYGIGQPAHHSGLVSERPVPVHALASPRPDHG